MGHGTWSISHLLGASFVESPQHAAQYPHALLDIPFVETRIPEQQPRLSRLTQVMRPNPVDADIVLGRAPAQGVELRSVYPSQPDDDVDAGVGADDFDPIAEVVLQGFEQRRPA